MKQYAFYILIVIFFIFCGNGDARHISPIAKNYIDEVITLLQDNSINKNKINWEDFKNDIYIHAKNAQTIEETYPSISYAISKLDDHHSYFVATNSERPDHVLVSGS